MMNIGITPREEREQAPYSELDEAYADQDTTLGPGPYEFRPGGSFILDAPDRPTAVWGAGDEVLWAEGEALLIASLQGLGKSTIGQQLALGRAGFTEYDSCSGSPSRRARAPSCTWRWTGPARSPDRSAAWSGSSTGNASTTG